MQKSNKHNDLQKVKEMAKIYLYADIVKTEYSPIIVKHPFTDSGVVCMPDDVKPFNVQFLHLTECSSEELEKWRKTMVEQIDSYDDVWRIYFMITKPYILDFVSKIKNYLNPETLGDILIDAWVRSEGEVAIPRKEVINMFKMAGYENLMTKEEQQVFEELPDPVTVFRGINGITDKERKGYSWTLSLDIAAWFSARFKRPFQRDTVLAAEINKADILAYTDARSEKEIIVDPRKLQEVRELHIL